MPKVRAPIATRLRSRVKNETELQPVKLERKDQLNQDDIMFLPRIDTDIYMDELQSPLSFVRGTSEERNQFVKTEENRMSQSFGNDYKSTLTMSNFYSAKISPPVPSKRTRHLKIQVKSPANKLPSKTYLSDTQTPSPTLTRYSIPPSPSPSISSLNSTPTPTPTKRAPSNAKKRIASMKGRDKKSNQNIPQLTTTTTSTPTQLMFAAAAEAKTSSKTKSKPAGKKSLPKQALKIQPIEDKPTIPLPLSKKLPVYIKMDSKDKEREYWRRQRRVFIHSRFVTNEEGVSVAKTVYSNLSIGPSNRMITSFQGNIANFRTKLRRVIDAHSKPFNVTKDYLLNTDNSKVIRDITEKMTDTVLKKIWGHWIMNPFVDTELFYADKPSVDLLRDVTVKILILQLKEHYNIITAKAARSEMRKLDLISRTINLPDTHDSY
ncbi:hypothetical protein HPULCUR_011346 [Helicostylum pulchrum]|uniref:Uncharacterized protein n=1 Tax=Helicostylum pulchrum TaxID=562976 RepID=A0ABP9YGN2_9FUNG